MKKTVSVLLAALLFLTLVCAAAAEEITLPVHVQGPIFGGGGQDSIALEIRFDPERVSGGEPDVYDPELAVFCALLSADVYFRTKDVDRGTPNRVLIDRTDPAEYSPTALLGALGCEDVRYIESYKTGAYETDPNDSVTLTLAYFTAGETDDGFILSVRGCFSIGEWSSIFDPGADTDAYAGLTGAHPEWTDTACIKGASVAAARAMAILRAYMAEHNDPSRHHSVLVTGHSRGGMIAEILGAQLEADPALKSRTYTFNAAPVTTDRTAPECRTVFNIYDSADFFSGYLPFGNETFYRYGRSVCPTDQAMIRVAAAALKDTDDYRCVLPQAAAEYAELFSALFPDRASLYEPLTFTRSFTDASAAAAAREECLTLLGAEAGLGLAPFASVDETEETAPGEYTVRIRYCRAALLICIGRVLAYGQSARDAVCTLFAEEEGICAIADWILRNAADISGGHRLLNSYVIGSLVRPEE